MWEEEHSILAGVVDKIRESYAALEVEHRLKIMAFELCHRDGGDPRQVVIGLPRVHLAVSGRSKQLAHLQGPVRPLWTHYLQDARNALEVVEMTDPDRKSQK